MTSSKSTIWLFFSALLLSISGGSDSPEVEEYDNGLGESIWYFRPKAITHHPTFHPTNRPTEPPIQPTTAPTVKPTKKPTTKPTKTPTMKPTLSPTNSPTIQWDRNARTMGSSARRISIKANANASISDDQLLENYRRSYENRLKPNSHTQNNHKLSIELYRYNDPLENTTDATTRSIHDHMHYLSQTNGHCLLILPYNQHTQSYNSSMARYYSSNKAQKRNTMVSIVKHILRRDLFADKSIVATLERCFRGLSPSKHITEAVQFLTSIRRSKLKLDTEIITSVFKYIEIGLYRVIQLQIKGISDLITNVHAFADRKQNILQDISSLLSMSLRYHQSNTMSLSQISMMMLWIERITEYWTYLFHFGHSVEIASIVFEWKRQYTVKKPVRIGIFASDVHMTSDLLHNIGYSDTDLKMFAVSPNPDGERDYIVSEVPPTQAPTFTQPSLTETRIETHNVSTSTIHIFMTEVGTTTDTIAKQVEILNDPGYDLVIVEHEQAFNASRVRNNRHCIYDTGWTCDSCNLSYNSPSSILFHCIDCQYDLCTLCFNGSLRGRNRYILMNSMDSRINTAAIPLMNQSDIQMDHILETMDASNLTTSSDPIPITTPPVLSPTASTSMHLDQEASHCDVNERVDALQSFHPIERQVRRNFASITQGMNDMILRDHLTHPAPSLPTPPPTTDDRIDLDAFFTDLVSEISPNTPVLSPTVSTTMHLEHEALHREDEALRRPNLIASTTIHLEEEALRRDEDALHSFHPIERQVRRIFASNTRGMNDVNLRDYPTQQASSLPTPPPTVVDRINLDEFFTDLVESANALVTQPALPSNIHHSPSLQQPTQSQFEPSPLEILLARLVCNNGHHLTITEISILRRQNSEYENGFTCDDCGEDYDINNDLRSWHCDSCQYDLCMHCYTNYSNVADPSSQELYDQFIEDNEL